LAVESDPDPTGPPWAKDSVQEFVSFIEGCINDALSNGADYLTLEDKARLESALHSLRPSVDELAQRFIEPTRTFKPWTFFQNFDAL